MYGLTVWLNDKVTSWKRGQKLKKMFNPEEYLSFDWLCSKQSSKQSQSMISPHPFLFPFFKTSLDTRREGCEHHNIIVDHSVYYVWLETYLVDLCWFKTSLFDQCTPLSTCWWASPPVTSSLLLVISTVIIQRRFVWPFLFFSGLSLLPCLLHTCVLVFFIFENWDTNN